MLMSAGESTVKVKIITQNSINTNHPQLISHQLRINSRGVIGKREMYHNLVWNKDFRSRNKFDTLCSIQPITHLPRPQGFSFDSLCQWITRDNLIDIWMLLFETNFQKQHSILKLIKLLLINFKTSIL